MTNYPIENLGEDYDDGTMPDSLDALTAGVIGRKIVSAERGTVASNGNYYQDPHGLILTLDDGRKVSLAGGSDCCAYTELEAFLLHPELVDHVITGVGTTDGFTKWHIFADMGDVLELTVGWSCGNPFYYSYGFNIAVTDVAAEV